MKDPIFFEKWFGKNKMKVVCLGNYKHYWDRPNYWFHTNGGKRKNGDRCFDLNINFGYFHLSYTNYGLKEMHMDKYPKEYILEDDEGCGQTSIIIYNDIEANLMDRLSECGSINIGNEYCRCPKCHKILDRWCDTYHCTDCGTHYYSHELELLYMKEDN